MRIPVSVIKNVVITIIAMLFTTVSFAAERQCYAVEMEMGVGNDPTIVWVTKSPVTDRAAVISCTLEDIAAKLAARGDAVVRKPAKVVNGKVVK